jgi:transposase
MCLQPSDDFVIPEQTAQIARAAFPNGTLCMAMRDEFGVVFRDEQFVDLYPQRGQPAETPWRLAWITLMQFAEKLTDRQAADAVRGRLDWKYALGLELSDPGFHYSVLCEFRDRLRAGQAEHLLFGTLLQLFQKRGWLKERSRQRTDSTHILAAVRKLNRVELVGETLYHALDVLAQVAPDWLKAQVQPEWFERYSQRPTSFRLPRTEAEQLVLAEQMGRDGWHLLRQVWSAAAPDYLRSVPAIERLRRIWLQNFYLEEDLLHWRDETNYPPSSQAILSPYDDAARFASKRDTRWHGYKVHLTETCEPDGPNLITHVETPPATEQDNMVVEQVHAALHEQGLLPSQHLVDAGYPSAELLVSSRDKYGVDLLGPTRPDVSWQSQDPQAFDITQFHIDWDAEVVTCPMGQTSRCWYPDHGPRGKPTIQIHFGKQDCLACASRARCTKSSATPRGLTLQPKEQQLALQAARHRQTTPEFKETYALRAGIEGTIGQATDKLEMRRSRYRGLAKTHFQHVATAAAINIKRVLAWLADVPRSKTRMSHFAALAPA